MNNRNMALSLIDNIGTCEVIFASTAAKILRLDTSMKRYTYAYDTAALELEEGSKVVVDAQGALKVCTVVAVHEHNEIDVSANFDYALIVDVVDMVAIANTEGRVREAYKIINESVRRDAKAKVISTFTGNMSTGERAKLTDNLKDVGITLEQDDG